MPILATNVIEDAFSPLIKLFEAIREYGILRGLVLAGWRLLRCNPWSYGGYDPVEAQRVFRIGDRAGA